MAYEVGRIEAVLEGRFDARDFDKFDRALEKAGRSTDALTRDQKEQARAMDKAGASAKEMARKLGVSERAVRDYSNATEKSARASERADRANDRMRSSMSKLGSAVKYASIAVGALAVLEVPRLINAYRESYKVGRQTNAVIESTGGVANVTAKQVESLATALSRKTGIDDEQIASTQNLLLTFTQIRNEAGKNNDIFNQTTRATLDLAKATGTDLTGAAKQVGKALNDPATGLTALRRSGASFNETQTETIKTLFESGKRLEAQKLILRELDREFAGSAVAQGDPFDKLRVSVENVEEAMGKALFPLFSEIADEAEKQFGRVEKIIGNPNLSGEEKFNRVFALMEKAINRGIDALNDRIPQIAEVGGKVGLKLAGGIVRGIINAPILGKLLIGAWIIKAFGGWGAIARLGGKAGGRLGKALGGRFLAAVAPYFAAEMAAGGLGAALGARMGKLKSVFGKMGAALGATFGRSLLGRLAVFFGPMGIILAITMEWGEQINAARKKGQDLGASLAKGIWDGIKDNLPGPVRDALDFAGGVVDAVTGGEGAKYGTPSFGGKTGGLVTPHGIVGMKTGGRVPGLHPDDTTPAMLEPGEFVLRKAAVDKLGIPFLRTLNNRGEVAKEADRGRDEIGDTFDKLGKDTKRKTEKTEKQVTDTWKSMRKKVGQTQGDLKRSVNDSWRDMDREQDKRTRDMDRATGKRFGSMLGTVRRRGGEMESSMGKTMGNLTGAVLGGMGKIASQTNKALKAFGVDPISFGIRQAEGNYAGGGFIPGQGKQDTVPLVMGMAAPGEAILSGPQQAEVEQSLAMTRALGLGNYGSLDSLFSNVRTPHYAYARGGRLPKFAGGGFTELQPGARALAQQLQGMGFTPTSTTGGQHAPGSHHYSGSAIDYGDSVNDQPKLWRILRPRARQFAELFGPSYLTPGPTLMNYGQGFSDARLQAGHEDHIHVALLGALAGGLSPVQIKRQILTGPDGALKSLGQAGLDKTLKAAQKYVQSKTASIGMDGPSGGGQWTALGRQLMLGMFPASEWPALLELWTRESGWSETATNPTSGAYGIPQALPPSKMGPVAQGSGPEAARAQINWGLSYIAGRYGTPSGALAHHNTHNWYARGGRIPGFDRGGVIRGRVSRFNDSETASGISAASNEGLALNLRQGTDSGWNNAKTQKWMRAAGRGKPYYADVGINGKSGIFPIIDLGPAGWVNRSIDVSHKAVRKMGLSIPNFPTDSEGEAWLLGQSRRPRKGSPSYSKGTSAQKEADKAREAEKRRRRRLAARKERWERFRKGQIKLRKEDRSNVKLPRFMRPFRPRIRGQAGILAAHSPISSDLDAYNQTFSMLAKIDPRLADIREDYLGTFDLDTSKSVFKRQEQIRRRREKAERRMRERYKDMLDRVLDGEPATAPGNPSGGIGPGPVPGPRKKPGRKEAQKIRAEFRKMIRKQTAAIRKRHNPASAMKPVIQRRNRLEGRFERLSARGETISDILSQAQSNVVATRRVSSAGRRALSGFASGGYVGAPMGGGAPVIHFTISDPTLAALDPHIEARVNGQIAQIGQVTKSRQRAAGSTGRRARL